MPGLLEESSDALEKNESTTDSKPKASGLPKGIVLDKDGKPCRTCTSSTAWMAMMKQSTTKPSTTTSTSTTTTSTTATTADPSYHTNCPPDVEELGHSSWTLLHTLTATYPTNPSPSMQTTTKQFISLFSQLYPCWSCAEDFRSWMARPENDPTPALSSQENFGQWMCRAHNEVNRKLGKEEFDCSLWRERWKDGWKDGRCG